MAYQLVYTSSPKGLKPGSFGFCVVACARGMKEQTTTALEALSGYRRVYAERGGAAVSPTSCSHVLLETSSGRLRVLARVADAGLDYSGRTNKIASFFVLAPSDLVAPGPAALFSQPGLFVERWTAADSPRYFETETIFPNNVAIPPGCGEWRRLAGDPGWAGVLASTVAERRPATLIIRPDQNALRLFQEALALLPPRERWNATFSTYYMKTPPGATCLWKAAIQGSPEEAALRRAPGALTIDLTNPASLPRVDETATTARARALVAAASGVVPTSEPRFRAPRTPAAESFSQASSFGALPSASRDVLQVSSPDVDEPRSLNPQGVSVPTKRKTLDYGRDAILKIDSVPRREVSVQPIVKLALAAFAALVVLVAAFFLFKVYGMFQDAGNAIKKEVEETRRASIPSSAPNPEAAPPVSEPSADDSESVEPFWEETEKPEESVAPAETRSAESLKDGEVETDVATSDADAKTSDETDETPVEPGIEDQCRRILEDFDAYVKIGDEEALVRAKKAVDAHAGEALWNDNSEFQKARARKGEIESALVFDGFQRLCEERHLTEISVKANPAFLHEGIYSSLDKFFGIFKDGAAKLTLTSYHGTKKNDWSTFLTASEFREYVSSAASGDAQTFRKPFRDDQKNAEADVELEIGRKSNGKKGARTAGLVFANQEAAANCAMSGAIRVEAFASSLDRDKSKVFEKTFPVTNCADVDSGLQFVLQHSKSPTLDQINGSKDSLFFQYIPPDGDRLLNPVSDGLIAGDILEKKKGGSKSPSHSVILKYFSSSSGTFAKAAEYAFEVEFEIPKNETTVKIKNVGLYRKTTVEWVPCSDDEFPSGVKTRKTSKGEELRTLRFRVRYRANKNQPSEETAILGILETPLELGKPRDD